MSHSCSTLPLPETRLTLHHCDALSRDTLQFATLSRGVSRRQVAGADCISAMICNTKYYLQRPGPAPDSTIRHSRSFSSFHPVPVPKLNMDF